MAPDDQTVATPNTRSDAMREEFRMAQHRRRVKRGVEVWRDTERPDEGPRCSTARAPITKLD